MPIIFLSRCWIVRERVERVHAASDLHQLYNNRWRCSRKGDDTWSGYTDSSFFCLVWYDRYLKLLPPYAPLIWSSSLSYHSSIIEYSRGEGRTVSKSLAILFTNSFRQRAGYINYQIIVFSPCLVMTQQAYLYLHLPLPFPCLVFFSFAWKF